MKKFFTAVNHLIIFTTLISQALSDIKAKHFKEGFWLKGWEKVLGFWRWQNSTKKNHLWLVVTYIFTCYAFDVYVLLRFKGMPLHRWRFPPCRNRRRCPLLLYWWRSSSWRDCEWLGTTLLSPEAWWNRRHSPLGTGHGPLIARVCGWGAVQTGQLVVDDRHPGLRINGVSPLNPLLLSWWPLLRHRRHFASVVHKLVWASFTTGGQSKNGWNDK